MWRLNAASVQMESMECRSKFCKLTYSIAELAEISGLGRGCLHAEIRVGCGRGFSTQDEFCPFHAFETALNAVSNYFQGMFARSCTSAQLRQPS